MKTIIGVFIMMSAQLFAQNNCYLDHHMKKGFAVQVFCYGSDTSKFMRALSPPALKYLDSVFNRLGIRRDKVICKKLTIKEGDKEIRNEKVDKLRYYYTAYERTFDCIDRYLYKNFLGEIKTNKKTKILLDYQKSLQGDYEMLKIYVLNKRYLLF